MWKGAAAFALVLAAAPFAAGADFVRPEPLTPSTPLTGCYQHSVPPPETVAAPDEDNPLVQRLLRYAAIEADHRVRGLASYYSSFFDGRRTANGEIYRNKKYSAAHLTLPLGTWIEVTARATGKKLRLRVNDRGPYAKKFCLDLSRAAARYLGVDRAHDRHVDIRIIALPGEKPLPEDIDRSILDARNHSVDSVTAAIEQ